MFRRLLPSWALEDTPCSSVRSEATSSQPADLRSTGSVERSMSEGTVSDDHLSEENAKGSGPNNFRQKYLRKLAASHVWVPQATRAPKHQSVIIFDWDDTLLCTSWLKEVDLQPGDAQLRNIVQLSKNLLESAIQAGSAYVITNAISGWVEYSAARWAPELLPALRKVQVVSARERFEGAFPDDIGQWKVQAFLEVQRQLDAEAITNVIALGDSDYEMDAAQIMGKQCEVGLVKIVKFQSNPDLGTHLKQLELVSQSFQTIIGSARSLKVSLASQ